MTDTPILDRPSRPGSPPATASLARLAVGLSAFSVVIGLVVIWDVLNPRDWTAAGWAAASSWVAGIATVGAVTVALRESKGARADALREAAAADERSRQALLAVRRDREVGALAALPYPIRLVSFHLSALVRRIEGLNEHDALHSSRPYPEITSSAVDLLARLDEFASYHLVKAIAVVDEALMVVKAPEAVSLLNDVHLELINVGSTITEWRGIVEDQEGPAAPSNALSHVIVLNSCLASFQGVVDGAYPTPSSGEDPECSSEEAVARDSGADTQT